jgi:sugar transferase (PEP-CTERM/EpsH1 system associated)
MNDSQPPLVVHLIYALGTGGLENGLVNIINRAPPGRYRHAIVCLTTADAFAGRITAADVPVITLNKAPGHDLALYWRLFRLLRELRPAILHTRNIAALEMQAIGWLLPGVRGVHGEHGRDIYDLDGSNRKYRLLRRLLSPLIRRFITVSRDLHDWLVRDVGIPQRKVVQIYNGVDQSRFAAAANPASAHLPAGFLPPDGVLIGTVGRLARVKDQRTLLAAFARVNERLPAMRDRLRLVLVGDGPLFDELAGQARSLGIEQQLWMAGDREEVPALLAMMQVFVLPSLAEGISNTILEAMASALPVVATSTGGNPELVKDGDNGYLVPVADADALAARLQQLLEDPDGGRRMGLRGRQRIEREFNWDRTVDRYLSIYDEVLAAG